MHGSWQACSTIRRCARALSEKGFPSPPTRCSWRACMTRRAMRCGCSRKTLTQAPTVPTSLKPRPGWRRPVPWRAPSGPCGCPGPWARPLSSDAVAIGRKRGPNGGSQAAKPLSSRPGGGPWADRCTGAPSCTTMTGIAIRTSKPWNSFSPHRWWWRVGSACNIMAQPLRPRCLGAATRLCIMWSAGLAS